MVARGPKFHIREVHSAVPRSGLDANLLAHDRLRRLLAKGGEGAVVALGDAAAVVDIPSRLTATALALFRLIVGEGRSSRSARELRNLSTRSRVRSTRSRPASVVDMGGLPLSVSARASKAYADLRRSKRQFDGATPPRSSWKGLDSLASTKKLQPSRRAQERREASNCSRPSTARCQHDDK
jgi:hypothetical protein